MEIGDFLKPIGDLVQRLPFRMRKGFSGAILFSALSYINSPAPDDLEYYIDGFLTTCAGIAALYGGIGIFTDDKADGRSEKDED